MPEPHASMQRRLLETEGVELGGGVIDMERYGWSPARKKPRAQKRKQTRSR
jgi:hypothetical protein